MAYEIFIPWSKASITASGLRGSIPAACVDLTHDSARTDPGRDALYGNHERARFDFDSPHLWVEDRGLHICEASNVSRATYRITWQLPLNATHALIETWTYCDMQVMETGFPIGEEGDGLDDVASNPFNARLRSVTYPWELRKVAFADPDYLSTDISQVDLDEVYSDSTTIRLEPSDMATVPGGASLSVRAEEIRVPGTGSIDSLEWGGFPAANTLGGFLLLTLVLEGDVLNAGIRRKVSGVRVTVPDPSMADQL